MLSQSYHTTATCRDEARHICSSWQLSEGASRLLALFSDNGLSVLEAEHEKLSELWLALCSVVSFT